MIDEIFKIFTLLEQGRAQWVLIGVVLILAGVVAKLQLSALKKADDEHQEKIKEHDRALDAHTEDLRNLKREQSEHFSRITQEIRETKMSNDASIKLLAYQLQTVETKVDSIGEALTKHTDSGEVFQRWIYERLGGGK